MVHEKSHTLGCEKCPKFPMILPMKFLGGGSALRDYEKNMGPGAIDHALSQNYPTVNKWKEAPMIFQ